MRCYPPLPVIGREALSDDRLGDVAIPRGAILVVFIYGTHHRADLWEDPDRFDPNRFLVKQAVPGAFLPFGLGPRACVGASFAILEMKIAFTAVLRAFRILPDAKGSPPPTLIPMVSLRTERPVFIRLEPR